MQLLALCGADARSVSECGNALKLEEKVRQNTSKIPEREIHTLQQHSGSCKTKQ